MQIEYKDIIGTYLKNSIEISSGSLYMVNEKLMVLFYEIDQSPSFTRITPMFLKLNSGILFCMGLPFQDLFGWYFVHK